MGRGSLIRLQYVHGYTDRHGHKRHYFRRRGKQIALPGLPGSDEFMTIYKLALADQPASAATKVPAPPGSFAALAKLYYASTQFTTLAKSSRAGYRGVIDSFLERHGTKRVDGIKRRHINAIISAMADKPGAAIVLLKRIRTLIHFAIDEEWITIDPTRRVKSYKSQELHTWTDDEIARYEARWPIGTRERLAFDLLLYTGQRSCDACRMARPDAADKIRVAQQKTKEKLVIAVHPRLRASLDAANSGHVAAIITQYGGPFSVKSFGRFVSAAIDAAGLPDECVPHGLRKAAARRLAEAGCSAKEIMSVTGHKTLAEVERYVRAADQERLNHTALTRQIENDRLATLPVASGYPIGNK